MPSAPRPKPSFPKGPEPNKPWIEWIDRQFTQALGATFTSLDERLDSLVSAISVVVSAAAAALTAANSHASRHVHSGADEIDGDTLDVDFTPSSYTRTTVGGLTTSTQELTSHLKGIDNVLASGTAAHATTHKRGGSDEIDGDLLDVDYSPSNYTRTSGSNGTTSAEELTSHLKGIDTKLGGSFTASAHASSHKRGGSDEIDGDLLDVDYSPTNYTRSSGANGTTSNEELTSHLTGIDNALLLAKTTPYGGYLLANSGVSASTTYYVYPLTQSLATPPTAITSSQMAFGRAGTIKNLHARILINTGDADTFSFTLNVEGSDSALTLTGLAGNDLTWHSDTTHSASVSADNLVTFKLVVGGAAVNAFRLTWSYDFVEP